MTLQGLLLLLLRKDGLGLVEFLASPRYISEADHHNDEEDGHSDDGDG